MEDEGAVQRMTAGEKRKRVEAAAGIANAHEFVSALSQGYDTSVGERGVQVLCVCVCVCVCLCVCVCVCVCVCE
jgi:hypothetical protein